MKEKRFLVLAGIGMISLLLITLKGFSVTYPLYSPDKKLELHCARKKGNDWWLAAMTNWDKRSLSIQTDFLDNNSFRVESFRDGVNADRNAMDY